MEEGQKKLGKKQLILIVALVLALALLITWLLLNNNNQENVINTDTQTQTEQNNDENQTNQEGESEEIKTQEVDEVNPVLQGAVTQAPGANLVTTDGRVVDEEGREVRSDVSYNDPSAPDQTLAITNQDEIKNAYKLSINESSFSPNTFTVAAGSAVTLALTGEDNSSHILAFESSDLSAVYINIRAGETRAVTFQAPSIPGEYKFFCDFPGHRGRGEEGMMVVQ